MIYKLKETPYFLQHDNLSGEGYRECFSSSCAMIAAWHERVETDDEYNEVRDKYGDTTDVAAHILTLKELGLEPHFHQNGNLQTLHTFLSIKAICPVAVGWLHKGHISHPSGGGHWSVVIDIDDDRTYHHDPYGEADES